MTILYGAMETGEDRGELNILPEEFDAVKKVVEHINQYYPNVPDCAKSKIFAEEIHSFNPDEDYERR